MITIICEKPEKEDTLNKLIEIFKTIKNENGNLDINLKIANRVEGMKSIVPRDNEIFIVFGAKLYNFLIKDIREFDKRTSGVYRDVHKYSYYVRLGETRYFLACLPPLETVILNPDSFFAFESLIKILKDDTENFQLSIRDVFLNKTDVSRKNWPVDVIEAGYSPKVRLLWNYKEQKEYMKSLFEKPDWHLMAIDTESTGLKIWDLSKHDIKIGSFSDEENLGVALNISLPGLVGDRNLKKNQSAEIEDLFIKYIFEKPKTFLAWFANFDIFGLCNKYGKTFADFLKANRIIDGIQILHAFSENRKATGEGYSIKDAARDLIGYAQWAYVEQYLDYIQNWESYPVEKIIERSNNSMEYAARDAAAEYTLTKRLLDKIKDDKIISKFVDSVARKIMEVKLEIEWNGLKIDNIGLSKAVGISDWENKYLVRNIVKNCKESTDGKCRTDMFLFSTTTGRVLYGKPPLNQMKIGESNVAKYIVADDDHSFVYIDLDSADLRSAALITQDFNLIDDLNVNGDYYMVFAKQLFSGHIQEKHRAIAKQFVLSMLNLAGDETIAKEAGVKTTDVKAYKTQFYDRYKKMLDYKIKLHSFLRENGYVMSPSFRKRRFTSNDLKDSLFYKSFLSAHNFPFQSTTTDLMALNCHRFIQETRSLGVKLCYWNVDAAGILVPDEYIEDIKCKLYMFSEIPGIIADGVIFLQEHMLGNKPRANVALKEPKFSFTAKIGKNLKELEDLK